jgi:phospholipid-binding lipoprotein MlaA
MKHLFLIVTILICAGCASNPADQYADPRDPLENTNRALWDFNYDVLDKNVMRPAAKGYEKLGTPVRSSIRNVLFNIEEPLNAVNNLLQGKVKDTGTNIGRFAINSTIGLLGIFDVASEWGLEPKREDFAQTFGSWGIGNGGYLMVPIYGPTTPRNLAGDVMDNVVYPMTLLNPYQIFLTFALSGLENRIQLFDQEPLLEQSLDSYNFVKEIYFQNDQFKVSDGQAGDSAFGGAQDEDFMDDELLLDDEPLLEDDQQ